MTTTSSPIGLPVTQADDISAKTPADYPSQGLLVYQFDTYVEGYGGAVVKIFRAGTTTLIPCYSDIGMTESVDNPQVLIRKVDDAGREFGRFASSIYVPYSYELQIGDDEQSGVVHKPLTDLVGDASYAEVTIENSTHARQLRDRFADVIRAEDYGVFGTSRASNTEIIASAISAAAQQGGGKVYLPSGTIPFTSFSIPDDVVLCGEGMNVTTISSESSGKIITLAGNSCGLQDLTVDGVQQIAQSIGIYSKARSYIRMNNVTIKRFQTNMHHQGGSDHVYNNLSLSDAKYCARLIGDDDFTGVGGGSEFSGLSWIGGTVDLSTQCGVELSMHDLPCRHNKLDDINFVDNIGADGAILIYGARHNMIGNSYFDGNDINITVQDHADSRLVDRQVVGLYFQNGQIDGGSLKFDGLCQDITINEMQLSDIEIIANVPLTPILLRNCVENNVLYSGDSTKILRFTTSDNGSVKGVTTDATATIVYKEKVPAGSVMTMNVIGTAEKQNATTGRAAWNVIGTAHLPPASLDYDELSSAFTAGSLVTGQTSGATAILTAAASSSSGTFRMGSITGDFVDNELITESDGTGSARVNGSLYYGSAALLGSVSTPYEVGDNTGLPPSGWDITIDVSGREMQVVVTGAASSDIVWNVNIQKVSL